MGRLFWKFFLIVWLAQLGAIFGTAAIFWIERSDRPARSEHWHPSPLAEARPPPPPHDALALPLPPILTGLLASLVSAGAIAWYVARPVRRLKAAFAAAAEGDLSVRIGLAMGSRRDELSELGGDFDRMSERLSNLLEMQSRLLHDVSHELRSPLARLHAAIGLARQVPGRFEETMLRLEREGERMNHLVGELLTLSRLEAGVGGSLETVDIDELVAGLAEDARLEAASRHLSVDLDETPGLRVRANPELLYRAVENVVRNALKHSPDGGRICIRTAATAEHRCRISILDHGPGVPEGELPHIFEPFRRTQAAIGGGHGLGLAIARRVMSAVDGAITARNLETGGLCVDLEIPLAAD